VTRPTSKLETIGEKVRSRFVEIDGAREKGLRLSRETIRCSATAIRSVHRKEYDEARKFIGMAQSHVAEMASSLDAWGELKFGGFVYNAEKEYAEACITLALVTGETVPDPDELGIGYAAYLNGLGEAAGELRRHLLDTLRKGDVKRCEEILDAMDDIFSLLTTMDFPDGMTGGLRRTNDMVRGVLERTRGDLTLSLRQRELEQKLDSLGTNLK